MIFYQFYNHSRKPEMVLPIPRDMKPSTRLQGIRQMHSHTPCTRTDPSLGTFGSMSLGMVLTFPSLPFITFFYNAHKEV